MSELDPLRAPKGQRWFFGLLCGVVTIMGLLITAEWWAGAEIWKGIVAAGLSVLVGVVLARAIVTQISAGKQTHKAKSVRKKRR